MKQYLQLSVLLFLFVVSSATEVLSAEPGHGGPDFASLLWPVLNFGLYAAVLVYVYKKILRQKLVERSEKVAEHLKRAAAELAAAEEKIQSYNMRLKAVDQEKKTLIAAYEKEGRRMTEEIIRSTHEAAERLGKDTSRQIERELEQSIKELRHETIVLATRLAREKLAEQLTNEDDRAIRQKVLEEAFSG